ncbi:MAG TPA: multicopper oxidase family protein [Candidatus Obscuribacterales bacterium]
MQRRSFLLYGGSALVGWAMTRCRPLARSGGGPTRLGSVDGQLAIALTAAEQSVTVAGRSATLLAYNQQVPGPLWEANAGDVVQIDFHNQLTSPTNLHFHGLHIPPTGTADNPFLTIPPGATGRYEFTIPAAHPGGLFWYHPHHHGMVAEQVFGGLAGAFIVRGAVDQIPEIQAASEAVLVLQDFDLTWRGQRQAPTPMWRRWGREGNLITVNGDRAPTLTLTSGGLLRLRLLNASPSRFYRLRLENHPWHLIGLDGGALPAPVELDTDLILAPGERADLLVAGDRPPDRYTLLSWPDDRGLTAMMGGMGEQHRGDRGGPPAPTPLAQIQYGAATAAAAVPLPTTLIPATPLANPVRRREFILDHGLDDGQYFLINGRGFDHDRVDTTVTLGTVEDWHIINRAGMDHPFHIHTNAFQILRQNGQPYPFTVWKDVVNVKAYETVDLRMAFTDFPGKTVYHCHVLDHEDQGMMGILDIQAPVV